MKKTMLALMATVGLAFGAKADVLNSTGFESYSGDFDYSFNDSGEAATPYYWAVTNTSADLSQTVLTAYGESATPVKVPDAFTNAANSTYLKVDTSADVLYRSVGTLESVTALNAGTEIGDGLYFDANVQFTASDGEPTFDSADKLVVWLQATEGENPTTNLVVTAGVYNEGTEKYDPTPFVIDGTYSADTWYRLTVKAMIDDGLTKFVVYVDDEQLKVGGTAAVFNSLVQTGDNKATLTAVGFQGTGAVDNLVWTTEDPFPPEATYTLALTFEDEDAAITSVTVNGTEYEIEEASLGLNVTFPTDTETLTISVDLFDGYAIDGWESAEKVITVSEAVQEGVIALTLTVTAAGGGEVPTSGEAEPGKPATVKAENAAAAEAAVTVKVDDAVAAVVTAEQKDAFAAAFFNKEAVDNEDGTFTVSVTVNEDAVEDVLDEVIEEALETASDGEITTIPAGLCYKIESGSTVSLGTEKKGVSTGAKIEVGGLSDAAGFYKVTLDVKPIE